MTESQKDYNWIQGVMESCENKFHMKCIDKLIDLFAEKHDNKGLAIMLMQQRDLKLKSIQ